VGQRGEAAVIVNSPKSARLRLESDDRVVVIGAPE
jgi:hypothetical protein